MADDDTSAAPWGRPGGSGRRGPDDTPVPDQSEGTAPTSPPSHATQPAPPPPPPTAAPTPPPASRPSLPADPAPTTRTDGPPPPVPPPPPPEDGPPITPSSSLVAGGPHDLPTHPQAPAGPTPTGGPRGAGLSGGAIAALAAVVVLALVATGVGVFLVTRSDDPGASPSGTTSPSSSASGPAVEEIPTTGDVSVPPTTADTIPDPTSATDDFFPLPEGDGLPGNVPEQLPRPEGATPAAIGLEADMPIEAVASFYEATLPPEGYTVSDGISPLGSGQALDVAGNGLTGQLLIAVLGGPETSILWIPG